MIALPASRSLGTAMSALVAAFAVSSPVHSREIVQVHRAAQMPSSELCAERLPVVAPWAPAPLRPGEGWHIDPAYTAIEIPRHPLRGSYDDRVRASIRTVANNTWTGRGLVTWPKVQRAASGY